MKSNQASEILHKKDSLLYAHKFLEWKLQTLVVRKSSGMTEGLSSKFPGSMSSLSTCKTQSPGLSSALLIWSATPSMLLPLLLSHFGRVQLCATPSLGFSRQEHWSGLHFFLQCIKVKSESEVAQSCLTLRNPMDCSLPDSSIHGIFQARVLEWGAIAFSFLLLLGHLKRMSFEKVTLFSGAPQVALVVKNLPANSDRSKRGGFDLWVRRSPGEEHGNPLQYSCLENSTDKGAW